MTIPPLAADPEQSRPHFRRLREMRGEAFVDVRDAQGNSTTPVPNGPAPKEPHKATLTPEQVQQSASGG